METKFNQLQNLEQNLLKKTGKEKIYAMTFQDFYKKLKRRKLTVAEYLGFLEVVDEINKLLIKK